jgi:hypothetical protein
MSESKKPVCVVCIRIRWFLFMAVPLLLLMGTQTDLEPPEIPLHELVAQGHYVRLGSRAQLANIRISPRKKGSSTTARS